MAEGIYTEREWRRQGAGIRPGVPVCWGAQYIQVTARKPLRQNRMLHRMMLLCSLVVSLLIPVCFSRPEVHRDYPMAVVPASSTQEIVRAVPGVSFILPDDLPMTTQTYTMEELYRGKLLLIDDSHPLPREAPAPNTLTIATYGKGMVPVNDLSLKSGRETIQALTGLFAELRAAGAGGFAVWQGTLTPAEQREAQLSCMRLYAGQTSLEEAAHDALAHTDAPRTGELQQEYTVEIRMGQSGSRLPDESPLEETVQGRQLLSLAWRNGFIRTHATQGGPYSFRYVGKAHATAMTYLDVDLATYLQVLHEKQVLTIRGENQLYVIQCIPVEGAYIKFQTPVGAACEASMDNTGYAVIACTIDIG